MKRLWIAAALLVAVVGLCIGAELYQHRRTEDLMTTLERLENAYAAGNTEEALVIARQLEKQYEGISRVMYCFIAHSDLSESQETVAMLPTLVERGEAEELHMEIARLRKELRYLRNIDDPLLQNIL